MVQNNHMSYGESKKRLESIFDAGTFVELGAYTKRNADPVGVVCGYGAVNGNLVFAFAQDSTRKKGAFDEKQSNKIIDMYSLALKNGAPVVAIFDSMGAVVYDGAAALAAYGKLMKCVSGASGIIPQIAIVDGVCAGSAAAVASLFDLTVTIKDVSKLYVNVPFVVGDDLKASDFAAKNGTAAILAENEDEAFETVKKLLALVPANNSEGAYTGDVADDLNRTVELDAKAYSAEELVNKVADNASFVRLYKDYCDNYTIGLATFGGIVACVVASEPEKKGIVDIKSARAISKVMSFCDSFNIPVVTLVNSEGLDVSLEAEYAAYSSELARLASVCATSTSARVSVVMDKAYGAAFTLLASKSLGADIVYALDDACISVLSPEASVAFVWNDKINEGVTREEVEKEWKEKFASADAACELGEVDDVIESSELRKRICSALMMLAYKSDKAPERKHSVLPL